MSIEVIYTEDGKMVGTITHDKVLSKKVSKSKHMLRKPPGWAWDKKILEYAKECGVEMVNIHDKESGDLYVATLSQFYTHGVKVNRGYGEQVCLPIRYWQIIKPSIDV